MSKIEESKIEGRRLALLALAAALTGAVACAPKIYVIDRQTILEQEAAGEWPQFERELAGKSLAATPEPFGKLPPSPEQKRLYNVLNGELLADAGSKDAPKAVPAATPKAATGAGK